MKLLVITLNTIAEARAVGLGAEQVSRYYNPGNFAKEVRLPSGRNRFAAFVLGGSLANLIWYSERATKLEATRTDRTDLRVLIGHKPKWSILELPGNAK